MPYIPEPARATLKPVTNAIEERPPINAGELQYLIAVMVAEMKNNAESSGRSWRYQDFNDVMGALAGAQMEYYRRHVAPYEDKKISENGDV